MTLRTRIALAVAVPSIVLLAVFGAVTVVEVRRDRLRDLDLALQARAAAVASYVEYHEDWEFHPIPAHVTAPLAGYEVRHGDETLIVQGVLQGRSWSGPVDVESPDGRVVEVRVAQDTAAIDAGLLRLLGQLALAGAALTGCSVAAAAWLSRRIVAGEDFQRLHRAWVAQTAFTADASHALRSPLTSVRTEAEVALRQQRPPEQYREALQETLAAALRMQGLLDGLLVLARAGEPAADLPVDLYEVARSVVEVYTPPPGVQLGLEGSYAPVRGDARMLRIAVDNLVANALRHTTRGAVVVRVGPRSIEVADTGEGIPEGDTVRVFERFHRVDAARGRATGGAGLGLAIVRAIAEQHGGTATLTTSHRGTTVTLRLKPA